MSIDPSTEFDPAQTLDLWVYLPPADSVVDLDAWLSANVDGWTRATGADDEASDRVARFLRAMLAADRLPGYPYRFVFLVDPAFGATVFDIAVAQDDPTESLEALVSTSPGSGSLGVETSDFTMNGSVGVQSVMFDLDGEPGNAERAIRALATVAVRRSLKPFGQQVVLARCATRHLESLVTSLLPLQYLMTSTDLDELVGLTI